MNIKWNVITSNYDKETGISYVTIATDLGIFDGMARLHEEDKDIASIFQGCRYAEGRACLKYLNLKLKLLENKIEGLSNFYNNCKQMRCFNENNKQVKLLKRELEKYLKQYTKLENLINNIKNGLYNEMKNYRIDKEKFYNKIKNTDKEEPTNS